MHVGTVVYWYSALEGVNLSLPHGWMLCNGAMVTDPASPLYGKNVPDLYTENEPRYIIRVR